MNQRNPKTLSGSFTTGQDSANDQMPPALFGLAVTGTIIDRMRRLVPKENPTTEIVTYTIIDSHNRKYYVDDYDTRGFYHDLNSRVSLPVYVKTYVRKNGDPSYTLNIQKEHTSRNEHF